MTRAKRSTARAQPKRACWGRTLSALGRSAFRGVMMPQLIYWKPCKATTTIGLPSEVP